MNEIVMIPVSDLYHHPENPRLDLGDLTELADSIRANGVMQNLTVVRGHPVSKEEWIADAKKEGVSRESALGTWEPDTWRANGFTVVIGNRRMEAAKLAGLAEVPCVISCMDRKTQISTMLMENMQRADLTVYEQAQGFQMMMNLGFSAKEIGEKTGFGETTVRRRLKMAEMDPKLLKKACEAKDTERQVTLFDFDRLAQVKNIKERNALLKTIGDREFGWQINRTLRRQAAHEVKPEARKTLNAAGAKQINQADRYSSEYDNHYDWKVDLAEWKPGTKLIPETEKALFWFMDDDTCYFFTKREREKKEKKPEKSAEEKAREQEIAEAWKQMEADEKTARQLREEFVKGLSVNTKNAMWMFQWFLMAASLAEVLYKSPRDRIMEIVGASEAAWTERVAKCEEGVLGMPAADYPKVIMAFFEECARDSWRNGNFKNQRPVWQKNRVLDLEYEWLCSLGYEMTETEKQLQDGTHGSYLGDKK